MQLNLKQYDNETLTDGLALAKSIEDIGYEAYLVGGCVRDMVRHQLGQIDDLAVHDIDIATSMPMDLLPKHFRTASNNGEKHGTILVFQNGNPFEVTHFRTDGEYTDGRHPEHVTLTESFEEDTARRDFTINALGLKWDGTVIDYHGGVDDIKNRIIRTVGDPEDRFKEDALRIIRGNRFAAKFGYSIDNPTSGAMGKCGPLIEHLSNERIRDEILKVSDNNDILLTFVGKLSWVNAWRHVKAFQLLDRNALISFLQNNEYQISRENVIPVIAYFGTEDNLNALVPTREETKLYKWMKTYGRAYSLEFSDERYWTELVKFASNDYKLALALDSGSRRDRSWLKCLPPARYIFLNQVEIKKRVSNVVKSMGIAQGKEYGETMDRLLEEEYAKVAGAFPTTIVTSQGKCKLVYSIISIEPVE